MIIHRFLKHLIGMAIFGVSILLIDLVVPGIGLVRATGLLMIGVFAALLRDFTEKAF